MKRGIVLIAQNTEEIDYVSIAKFTAHRAKKFLNCDVTLITNQEIDNHPFNQVIVTESLYQQKRVDSKGNFTPWKNFDRYKVYELSPYDHTLLLDIDYIINSDQLNKLWELDNDFLCHEKSKTISRFNLDFENYIGQYKLQMLWATVVMFKKSDFSKAVFDMWHMIQQNYIYYAGLYKFNNQLFRNDYALTIALNTVSGHLGYEDNIIKWPLLNSFSDVDVTKLNETEFEFNYQKVVSNSMRPYKLSIKNTDFHCMNKFKLLELINE